MGMKNIWAHWGLGGFDPG